MADEMSLGRSPTATPTATSTPQLRPIAYGSVASGESSRNDSAVAISPDLAWPGYTHPHQHRIIPPSIKGHGRLIVAHRTVPYWQGVLCVVGAFTWAVLCAVYAFPVLTRSEYNHKAGQP